MRCLALGFFDFEHVADVHEADHLVDVVLVDRDARVLLVDDQLAQILERSVGLDGDDAGPRRHHFAHHLVAELDHGLDQLAILFFDEAFFGAGGDQGFDIFGGCGRLFGGGVSSARSISDWKKESSATQGRAIQRDHPQQAEPAEGASAADVRR